MSFTLGYAPQDFVVILTPGSDFFAALRRSDGADWDADLALTLDFGDGHVWPAELADDVATWDVDQADVDAVLGVISGKVRLFYTQGGVHLLWATGYVSVRS